MKKIYFLVAFMMFGLFSIGQSSTATFNFTGGPQSWTVPPCVGTVTITVAGAQGATIGGATGGNGAVISITMPVTPGDNFGMLVGGQGANPGAGFNGGGTGYTSTNGNNLHNSGGGGGATNLSYNGSLIAIAAGGGGAGGGSVNNNGGGAGGCANGSPGGNTFGNGGGGGSQVSGGNGGAPWAGVPPGGVAGGAGQGGQGGLWLTASGGGGGGGYFGGGGGGNDGCCTGANGGGGGGGGSSLIPAGGGCTGGSNTGNGYVTITWGCENVPPTASNPASINVECIAQVPAPDINVVTDALDNCDPNPVVAFVGDVSDGLTCPETITRTYSVTDSCLNQILVTQSIIIQDITPPTASNPPGGFIVCSADLPPVDVAVVNDEADNCAMPIVVAHVSDVSDGNICPEIITRTYSVTDGCGNSINLTQIFTVHDNIAPTASNPASVTVSCLSDVPLPNPNVVIDEADNCTLPITVAHVSDVSNGNSCNGEIITRTYSVTDACGNSINVTQEIFIDAFIPTVGAGIDQTVCEGVQVKLIAANPDGAAISWDQGVVDGSLFNSPIGTTNYTVTADICNGECLATDNVNVKVNLLPVIDFESDTLIGCEPLTTVFTSYSTQQNSCVWNFGDGHIVNDCGPVSNDYKMQGIYDVTLTVTSIDGCISTETYNNYIEVVSMPEARFQASDITVNFDDPRVKFTNNSLFANTYAWSFGDSSHSALLNPTHDFPTHQEGSYLVTLTATNFLGCSHSTSQLIYVEDVLLFYVPNTFTPDGDAFNESFKPIFTEGVNIYDFHFMIFNRWGEVMFESYNPNSGWNGHYGDGGLVEDGTYIWQVDFSETGVDNRHKVNGHVTVLK